MDSPFSIEDDRIGILAAPRVSPHTVEALRQEGYVVFETRGTELHDLESPQIKDLAKRHNLLHFPPGVRLKSELGRSILSGQIWARYRRLVMKDILNEQNGELSDFTVLAAPSLTTDSIALLKDEGFSIIEINGTELTASTDDELRSLARRNKLEYVDQPILEDQSKDVIRRWARGKIAARKRQLEQPSVAEIASSLRTKNPDKIGILADENLFSNVYSQFDGNRYFVVAVRTTRQRGADDQVIAQLAKENDLILITNDHGFLYRINHDLTNLQFVMVFPNRRGNSNYLGEFVPSIVKSFREIVEATDRSDWIGTSVRYRRDGSVTVSYPSPVRSQSGPFREYFTKHYTL